MSLLNKNSIVQVGDVKNPDSNQYQDLWQQLYSGDTKAVEEYLRSKGYAELVQGNPYNNLNYRQTTWQKLLSSWGFRTKYDSAMEQANLQSREYLAGLLQQAFQNDYNSPTAEAERMRQAGLNPDLLGTEGVANSATPPEDNNVMSPDTFQSDAQSIQNAFSVAGQAFNIVTGIGDSIGKCVASALTVAESLQGIESNNINLSDKYVDTAIKIIQATEGPDFVPNVTPVGTDDKGNPITGSSTTVDKTMQLISALPGSKKYRKRMAQAVKDVRNGLVNVAGTAKTRAGMGSDLALSAENSQSDLRSWRGVNQDEMVDTFARIAQMKDEITKDAIDFNNQMMKLQLKWQPRLAGLAYESQESAVQNELEYNQEFDGQVAAQVVNEKNRNDSDVQQYGRQQGVFRGRVDVEKLQQEVNKACMEFEKALRQRTQTMLNDLISKADEGKKFARTLVTAMTISNFADQSGLMSAVSAIGSGVMSAVTGVGGVAASILGAQNTTPRHITYDYGQRMNTITNNY